MIKEIIFLREQEVIEIHDMVLSRPSDLRGLSKERPLSSVLNRVHTHFHYLDKNNIYELGALYAISIAQGHPFVDGNKRTAMICMSLFLSINNIFLVAPNEEIEQIMVDVAEKKMTEKKLIAWLKKYTGTVEELNLALKEALSSKKDDI